MAEKKKEEAGGLDLGNLLEGIFKGLNIEELLNAAEKLANLKGDKRAKEDVRKMKEGLGKTKGVTQNDVTSSGLGGLFKGIFDFVEKASKEGGEFTREFKTPSGKKGVFSFGASRSMLTDRTRGEKFEVKRHESKTQKIEKKPKSEEKMRQLNLDVFDEKDHILIIGDMPGVEKENIRYEVEDNVLKIWTEVGRRYQKEIKLSSPVTKEVDLNYRNGVLEIKLIKKERK